jgi:hypothetical protein
VVGPGWDSIEKDVFELSPEPRLLLLAWVLLPSAWSEFASEDLDELWRASWDGVIVEEIGDEDVFEDEEEEKELRRPLVGRGGR